MATPVVRQAYPIAPWGNELPLVGRLSECDALRLALDDALGGKGHSIMLVGEVGVGKSRLLSQLEREGRARGMVVASGRAFSVESSVPYGAIADALAAPLRALDASELSVLARGLETDLNGIFPAVLADHSTSRSAVIGTHDSRARQFWSVAQFLTRLSERDGALLVLDDAHWSDPSSLELLHFISRQLAKARVLIVVAYSDLGLDANSSLRRMAQSLADASEATSLHVDRLTRFHLVDLLQQLFALETEEAATHADALHERTRGNPFFVEHALRALLAESRIRHDGSRWIVERVTSWTLPTTVRDAVRSRIDSLSSDARRVADAASVLDRPAPLKLLARLVGLDSGALADAVDELCRKRLLIERRETDDASYEFTHPILHETVRGELSAARRRALHAALMTALESMFGYDSLAHASEIARHLMHDSLSVRLPPRNAAQETGALTGRELEIARAVARRLSNKEIGRALGISSRTVSTHLSHIFVKLGVDSRGALVDLVRADPQLRGDAPRGGRETLSQLAISPFGGWNLMP